jgi:hypothetical protein
MKFLDNPLPNHRNLEIMTLVVRFGNGEVLRERHGDPEYAAALSPSL